MTSADSNFNFLCGRPHGAGPPPSTCVHLSLTPPPCGRHKWMAPYVIAIFLGPHVGYTKLLCFLCDSRADKDHCKGNAGLIEQFLPGVKNIKYVKLVEPYKIPLQPLHMKLLLDSGQHG